MCAPCVSASEPRPPEVLNASYERAVDLDLLQSLERRHFHQAAIAMAWQGLPYSLMSPSVDQVSEYLRTLFGCCGRAPTRSFTARRVSKCVIALPPAMLMKPGASPHCGTKAWRRAPGDGAHRARDLDVLGQIEVVEVPPCGPPPRPRRCSDRAGSRSPHRPGGLPGAGPGRRIGGIEREGGQVARPCARTTLRPPRRPRRPAGPGNRRIRLVIRRSVRRFCRRQE